MLYDEVQKLKITLDMKQQLSRIFWNNNLFIPGEKLAHKVYFY